MSDLISRSTVIDAIKKLPGGKLYLPEDIIDVVESLPSAQPERAIKDCRNCKFGDYNDHWDTNFCYYSGDCNNWDKWEPSAQPERLTDDDFETIRIHLSAYKEKLCNQQRWKEAEEYQRIIDRFMAFVSAQPETCSYWDRESNICALHRPSAQPRWIPVTERLPEKSGLYLVTTPFDRLMPVHSRYFNRRGDQSFWSGHPMDEVVAWMPLPTPYREEQDDSKRSN